MLGILFKLYLSFSQRRRTWTYAWPRKHPTSRLLFISLCIHAFSRRFSGSHHQDLAVGIAIHHLPIVISTFFINSLHKSYFWLYAHLY
jgi:hypothetical protein